ncbi:toxin-activating lysine-acyltransferase [Ruegeria atlantica]|uniref:toxin-activating lysine-acyltransferase n=1 Tax=Ruegeria atlantica TaxID=81569 RepID=UPI00147A5EB5|nr:toxin-activating lysine-acyltransferase [Ruegeria atlantica]
MVIDRYVCVGFAIELLSRSGYHQGFDMDAYLSVEVLPPLRRNQGRFYLTKEGKPTAMLTWAWLSEDCEADVLSTGRATCRCWCACDYAVPAAVAVY